MKEEPHDDESKTLLKEIDNLKLILEEKEEENKELRN